ncbi:hypothetical protein [Streptomyces sp. BH055]|uniref:hypothetical protein n=1 Tax=Streptomyces sp. BH055 TaxID=3401173 RepID=UPI003BB5E930
MTETPATDEQLRTVRRDSIGVLLARIERGLPVTAAAAQQLRRHVDAEIRDADTERAVARSNLRHVREIVPALERAEAAIERLRAYCDVRDTAARLLTGEPTAVDVFAEIIRHKLDRTKE